MRQLFDRLDRFISARLNQRYISFVCSSLLAVYLIAVTVSFATQKNGRTIFGSDFGADFASFYIAGKIYNEHDPARVYDQPLHTDLYHRLVSESSADSGLPFANAPFFVTPFIFLSRLSYTFAYLAWIVIALGLYLAGIQIITGSLSNLDRDARKTALLISITFVPFLLENLAGGQVSAFGFFWLALAIS